MQFLKFRNLSSFFRKHWPLLKLFEISIILPILTKDPWYLNQNQILMSKKDVPAKDETNKT